MTPDFSVYTETPSAPIALIATPGAEELAQLIDKRLITLFSESHLGKNCIKIPLSSNPTVRVSQTATQKV